MDGPTAEHSITVVYLSRGIGGGFEAAEKFFTSYTANAAGLPHRLVVVVKGYGDAAERERVERLARLNGGEVLLLPDDGFDLGAYFRAAEVIDTEWICVLNTHSEPLAAGWLRMLWSAARQKGIGAAGATGSLGSLAPTLSLYWPALRGMRKTMPLPWFLLRAAASVVIAFPAKRLFWLRWPPFPNPHLRTNGLVLRTKHLRAFGRQAGIPLSKSDAWRIESSRNSLTRWLAAQDLTCVVVDRHGNTHGPEGWHRSGTFRTPKQSNLLIADNQTRSYDAAGSHERQIMELSAWGQWKTPETP